MRRSFVCGIAALVFAPGAFAQSVSPQCPPGAFVGPIPDNTKATQDACQKAIDLFQYLAPQLGTIIAGGNATLGSGGALGGLPHFGITVRGNVMQGSIPQIDQVTPAVDGATSSQYPTKKQIIGLPTVDMSVGLFKGLPIGISNIGGLDLIMSVAYLPSVSSGSVDVKVPDGSFKFGFGGRLGLLQESMLTPGISVTYLRRDLPTVNIAASSGNDSLRVNQLKVQTKAWRVVANKNLMLFGLAVGAGKDKYSSGGNISAYVAPRVGGNPTAVNTNDIVLKQDLTRTNYFADLSMNLVLFKLTGEIGRVSGGSISTYNTFEGGKADDARTYGSVGLRFGF